MSVSAIAAGMEFGADGAMSGVGVERLLAGGRGSCSSFTATTPGERGWGGRLSRQMWDAALRIDSGRGISPLASSVGRAIAESAPAALTLA